MRTGPARQPVRLSRRVHSEMGFLHAAGRARTGVCLAAFFAVLCHAQTPAAPGAGTDGRTPAGRLPVSLTVVGGPNLNPNLQDHASPVVVHVYELRRPGAFEKADFAALFEHPRETLGEDLAAQEEFLLRPGDIQHRDRAPGAGVVALGFVAAFRSLDGGTWRLVVPVSTGARELLLVALDGYGIRVPFPPDDASPSRPPARP